MLMTFLCFLFVLFWFYPCDLLFSIFLIFSCLILVTLYYHTCYFHNGNFAVCLYCERSHFHPSYQHHYSRPWCHHHYDQNSGHYQAVSGINGSKASINIRMPFLVPYFMHPMPFFSYICFLLRVRDKTRWFACRSYLS